MIDYYRILGVSRSASVTEVKGAFRVLAQRHHPDKSEAPDAATQFIRVAEAYEVLRDPERRRAYDRARAEPGRTDAVTNHQRTDEDASFRRYAAESRAKAEQYSRMSWSEVASVVLGEAALHGKYAYHFGCGPFLFIAAGVGNLIMLPMMLSDGAFDNPAAAVLLLGAICVGLIWFGIRMSRSLSEEYKAEKTSRRP